MLQVIIISIAIASLLPIGIIIAKVVVYAGKKEKELREKNNAEKNIKEKVEE
jgi:hypothetical protein